MMHLPMPPAPSLTAFYVIKTIRGAEKKWCVVL